MVTTVPSIQKQLKSLSNVKDAVLLQRFFKTGPGEYAEGDQFIGIKVPPMRTVAKANLELPIGEVPKLLASPIHEHRSVGLMIWVMQFEKGDAALRKQIHDLYLSNTVGINNWDLVDLSCPTIVGSWLLDRSHTVLRKLAKSKSLWERRIAVVSTQTFIRHGRFDTTLNLCRQLMADKHDLMHKACGWMLREIYKRDVDVALRFVEQHAAKLPRTTLRYAIERCVPAERARLMKIGLPDRPASK
jgi:hypothetical protein